MNILQLTIHFTISRQSHVQTTQQSKTSLNFCISLHPCEGDTMTVNNISRTF